MSGTSEQDAWVSKVLGFTVPGAASAAAVLTAATAEIKLPADGPARAPPIRYVSVQGRAVWQQAREAVDEQFGALQSTLQTMDDPRLAQVATQGYPALAQRLGTRMLAAMIEVDAAPPERSAAARAQASKTIAEYRALLASDPLVRLLDENPFGVPVAIKVTLGAALDQIERALQS